MSGPIVCLMVASVLLQLLMCLNGQIFHGNPLIEAAKMSTSINKLDDCFCEVSPHTHNVINTKKEVCVEGSNITTQFSYKVLISD